VLTTRDVALTKEVWECTQKIANLKHIHTHFKAKREKRVGTPFPRVPPATPLMTALLLVTTFIETACVYFAHSHIPQ